MKSAMRPSAVIPGALAAATMLAGVTALVVNDAPDSRAPAASPDPAGPERVEPRRPPAARVTGRWFGEDGRPLPGGRGPKGWHVASVVRGPGHCAWQSVEILLVSWPIGTAVEFAVMGDLRVYVRHTQGVLKNYFGNRRLARLFDPDAELPEDARPTGFHREGWALWFSPSDASRFAYLVGPDQVERWVRPPRPLLCD